MRNFDPTISRMEELDPEPSRVPGRFWLREFILGVLIIVGVLGFAGWQWWQTESYRAQYDAGQQAAQARNWESAEGDFEAAGDYKDAPAQARQAANTILQRNLHYSAAEGAILSGQWLQALQEISATEQIQPRYRSLEALGTQARGHVYGDALNGAVVMRPRADPPGLYYYGGTGWVWLAGSDSSSSVLGAGTPDRVIYDVSKSGTPAPTASTGNQLSDSRAAVVAFLDSGVTSATLKTQTLPLPFSDYRSYTWDSDTAWAPSHVPAPYQYDAPLRLVNALPGNYVRYNFATGLATTVSLTRFEAVDNSALLDYDARRDRVLSMEWDGTNGPFRLYLNDAGTGARRLLYTGAGGLVWARLSEDGNYIFADTYVPRYSTLDSAEMLLLMRTTGHAEAVQLAAQRNVSWENSAYLDSMQVASIAGGAYAGHVLVTQRLESGEIISIVDPDHASTPYWSLSISRGGAYSWDDFVVTGNGLILLGRYVTHDSPASQSSKLALVSFRPDTGPLVRYANLNESAILSTLLRGSLLICTALAPNTENGSSLVFSVPAPNLQNATVQPQYLVGNPSGATFNHEHGMSLGTSLFAYLQGRDFHVQSYNGKTDLKLDSGITHIFDFAPAEQQGYRFQPF